MTTDTAKEGAQEARAKAEARRKRILEKSRDRMNLVSGEQLRVPSDTDSGHVVTSSATSTASSTLNTMDPTEPDNNDATLSSATHSSASPVETIQTQSEGDENAKPSSRTARMNAMRKRYLAKKKEEEEEEEERKNLAQNTDVKQSSSPSADADVNYVDPAAAAAAANVKSTRDSIEGEDSALPLSDTTIDGDFDAHPATLIESTNDTDGEANAVAQAMETKKYRGVAATRRQMLKEKATASNKEASKDVSLVRPVIPTKKIPTLPIYMHLFTIAVIFSAGFLLSMTLPVQQPMTVHRRQLAPQQHGIGVLTAYRGRQNRYNNDDEANARLHNLGLDHDTMIDHGDEFDSSNDDTAYVPNIDPLFQVDLDLFTRGDSLLMMGARMAVALHRVNLFLFYYLPLSIVKRLLSIPLMLMRTPPVLCLFAILTRQFAKRVLGATLPQPGPGHPSSSSSSSSGKDIFGMIKQGITTFLSNSFPTLVELYDTLVHLKADMFILLCGLFVGLAYTHHFTDRELTTMDHDEL